jgi:Xaa-Pro dipeptidase
MKLSRRDLFKTASLAGGGLATTAVFARPELEQRAESQGPPAPLPPAFDALKPLGDRVKPIRVDEFQARIAHAQQLMNDASPKFDALYVAPGTSLRYYTGIRWGSSERIVALVIARSGDPLMICPGFEEARLREQVRWPIEIRVWQEDESPYALAAGWLGERGIRTGKIGV